ncbi:MAG: hypothetical protein ABIX12_05090 [Rubrivivax sp.]
MRRRGVEGGLQSFERGPRGGRVALGAGSCDRRRRRQCRTELGVGQREVEAGAVGLGSRLQQADAEGQREAERGGAGDGQRESTPGRPARTPAVRRRRAGVDR